jgi:hypothetical protein
MILQVGSTRKKTMEFQRDPFNLLGFIGVLRALNNGDFNIVGFKVLF